MGYLDIALTVVADDFEGKEGQKQSTSSDNTLETNCEKSEISEIRGPLDTEESLINAFRNLFEKTVADISIQYIPGTLEMIREDFPELAKEIQTAEDRVNELWLQAKTEAVDLGAFSEAVERWKTLHLRAIRFFSLTERPE